MRGAAGRSLEGQLIRSLLLLQTLLLLLVLGVVFVSGDLLAFRSSDRTIELLRHAVERDATGHLRLRETTEWSAIPNIWFVIRDAKGGLITHGHVPPVFGRLSEALPGIGQARFGSTLDSAAMNTPEARMRQVTTQAGEVQILTGTETAAPVWIIVLGFLLVLFKVGLPVLVVVVLGILIATPLVVRGAVSGIVRAEKQAALIEIGQRGVRLETDDTPPEIASLIRAINEAFRRLDEGYERQQRFLADAAHELRTPLAILGTRIAALPSLPERVQLIADMARVTMITEQLLDLERLQHDASAFMPVSLPALAKRVVGDMAPLAFAAGYELDFVSESNDGLVHGDEAALERALSNLIQNAIDHGGRQGTISVWASSHAIEVSDNGPGIPPEDREHVFEPFRRLKLQARGTGLGLHLVRRIVTLHGGSVWASDSASGGARVTIRLPAPK